MRYHAAIFRLLGRQPRVSAEAVRALEAREALCGRRFPASVREWYSLESAAELSCEELLAVEDLGDANHVAHGWLHVGSENQAVVGWFAKLDGSDDPPIFDNGGEWEAEPSAAGWNPVSSSYQAYVFDVLSWGKFHGWYTGMSLRAIAPAPDATVLERLRAALLEGPRTDLCGSQVHRFFTPNGSLRISVDPGVAPPGKAEWSFEASSADALCELVRPAWRCAEVAQHIEPASSSRETRAEGALVISRLARELGGRDPDAPWVDPDPAPGPAKPPWGRWTPWVLFAGLLGSLIVYPWHWETALSAMLSASLLVVVLLDRLRWSLRQRRR